MKNVEYSYKTIPKLSCIYLWFSLVHQRSRGSSHATNCNNSLDTESTINACNNAHHPITQLQNHSRLSVTRGSQGRRKLNNTSSDPGDYSPEGSCSGSTCSTMNVTSVNTSTIDSIGGGSVRIPVHQPHHRNQSASSQPETPDIITLSRANSHRTHLVLRRSENAVGQMSRAKNRTLVMTIVIVVMFVLCWTPYVVMTLW